MLPENQAAADGHWGALPSVKHLVMEWLNELEEVPGPFTVMESMHICSCGEMWQLETGGGELGSLKELTRVTTIYRF
jgi:hypothetical protein